MERDALEAFKELCTIFAAEVRLTFGANVTDEFGEALVHIEGEMREMAEAMFTQGARTALAVLVRDEMIDHVAIRDRYGV